MGHKRFGNSNLNALKKDETKNSRRFIEEESDESKCKDVDEDEKPLWLKHAEMKATDDTWINGREIQLQVAEGQCQLDETRRAEKWQKHHDALLKVRRDKEIWSACAILNSNNNIMNNSNNTNSTSHVNSITTTSSNVNNNNNLTITTTTSTNNSGTVTATILTTSISTYLMQGYIRIKVCLSKNSMTFLPSKETCG